MKPERGKGHMCNGPSFWPTVDEMHEAMLQSSEAAIHQILSGDAVYYGLPTDGVVSESRLNLLAYMRDLELIDHIRWM